MVPLSLGGTPIITCGGSEAHAADMTAEAVAGATVGPTGAGEVVEEAAQAMEGVEAAGMGRAAQYWRSGNMMEVISCWWMEQGGRGWTEMGEAWWGQKKQIQQSGVVPQYIRTIVAATRKEDKVAEAAVEAAAAEEAASMGGGLY